MVTVDHKSLDFFPSLTYFFTSSLTCHSFNLCLGEGVLAETEQKKSMSFRYQCDQGFIDKNISEELGDDDDLASWTGCSGPHLGLDAAVHSVSRFLSSKQEKPTSWRTVPSSPQGSGRVPPASHSCTFNPQSSFFSYKAHSSSSQKLGGIGFFHKNVL